MIIPSRVLRTRNRRGEEEGEWETNGISVTRDQKQALERGRKAVLVRIQVRSYNQDSGLDKV